MGKGMDKGLGKENMQINSDFGKVLIKKCLGELERDGVLVSKELRMKISRAQNSYYYSDLIQLDTGNFVATIIHQIAI